ncbi:MAG: hypothetical protein ACPGRX_02920, partial [Bdellovibrionales bacterium]
VIAALITLILIGAAASNPAYAWSGHERGGSGGGALCTTEDTKTTVKLATSKTRYVKSQNAFTLTALHNSGGGITLGLAGGPIDITIKGRYGIRSRNGRACVHLENLDVLFWAKPVVLIASNFKKGSCEYREVLGHEQKHIRALRNFVRKHAPELKKEVAKIIKTTKTRAVVSENSIDTAQKSIEDPIIQRLAAYQNKIMPILRATQQGIDSPQEYARVAAKCENWGKKLATNN